MPTPSIYHAKEGCGSKTRSIKGSTLSYDLILLFIVRKGSIRKKKNENIYIYIYIYIYNVRWLGSLGSIVWVQGALALVILVLRECIWNALGVSFVLLAFDDTGF